MMKLARQFSRRHGYGLDLENPRSFNEKLQWRKIYDRNPIFPVLQDKFLARQYVREALGDKVADEILVPLYFVSNDPEEIPFRDLPGQYIVKPNHGSGWLIIVDENNSVQKEMIISQCRKWLKMTYGKNRFEWAYSRIKPLIMVEKLLKDSQGRLAPNFKFFVFNGRVEMIDLFYDHFKEQAFYDRDFRKLDVKRRDAKYSEATGMNKPERLDEMVSIAERLGSDLDFIRVDLYHVEGKIFFGEFTIYPASGFGPYNPREFDTRLGSFWDLNTGSALPEIGTGEFESWIQAFQARWLNLCPLSLQCILKISCRSKRDPRNSRGF